MEVKLVTFTPSPEDITVEVARASSSRKDKLADADKLVAYLIKNKHWSPFEHAFFTFEIITSKAIGIQLLRHRSNFFQEFSQRYQDVNKLNSDNSIFEFYEARKQAEDNRQSSTEDIGLLGWTEDRGYHFSFYPHTTGDQKLALHYTANVYNRAETAYNMQLKAGISRETARFILPMATKTRLYVTMNIRSLIHWLQLRDDGHAQLEAQLVAREIKKIAIEKLPITAKALEYGTEG